jgi:hypothetical protein
MSPNYIKECTKIVGKHNKYENVIVIWDEPIKKVQPNEIGFHLLITTWTRSRSNIGVYVQP